MVLTLKSTRPKNLTGYGGRMIQPIPIPAKHQTTQQPTANSLLPKAALMIESSPQNELYVPPEISFAQPKRNSLPEVRLNTNYANRNEFLGSCFIKGLYIYGIRVC